MSRCVMQYSRFWCFCFVAGFSCRQLPAQLRERLHIHMRARSPCRPFQRSNRCSHIRHIRRNRHIRRRSWNIFWRGNILRLQLRQRLRPLRQWLKMSWVRCFLSFRTFCDPPVILYYVYSITHFPEKCKRFFQVLFRRSKSWKALLYIIKPIILFSFSFFNILNQIPFRNTAKRHYMAESNICKYYTQRSNNLPWSRMVQICSGFITHQFQSLNYYKLSAEHPNNRRY